MASIHYQLYNDLYERIKTPLSRDAVFIAMGNILMAFNSAGIQTDLKNIKDVAQQYSSRNGSNLKYVNEFREKNFNINANCEDIQSVIEHRKFLKHQGINPDIGNQYVQGAPLNSKLKKMSKEELILIITQNL